MDYYIASAMNINITYGWLITATMSGGPAEKAGLHGGSQNAQVEGTTIRIGGDIILAMNGTQIINGDALSTYLEEHTQPGDNLTLTIKRNGNPTLLNVTVTLGTRPQP